MRESEKIFMCDRVFHILTEFVLGAAFGIVGIVAVAYLGIQLLSNQ